MEPEPKRPTSNKTDDLRTALFIVLVILILLLIIEIVIILYCMRKRKQCCFALPSGRGVRSVEEQDTTAPLNDEGDQNSLSISK